MSSVSCGATVAAPPKADDDDGDEASVGAGTTGIEAAAADADAAPVVLARDRGGFEE